MPRHGLLQEPDGPREADPGPQQVATRRQLAQVQDGLRLVLVLHHVLLLDPELGLDPEQRGLDHEDVPEDDLGPGDVGRGQGDVG